MSTEREFRPKMLGIVCNWCCYGGADLCGVSRFQYPPFIRLMRVMCSGRVDLAHIFRAFQNGMDAVFVGGCHINDCHYVTEGNYDAMVMAAVCKRLLAHIGLSPERMRLEWVSAGEGIRFAGLMNEYAAQIQELGPLGVGEGIAEDELRLRLTAVARIVPYLRLALAERLCLQVRSEEVYERFLASEELEHLLRELVFDKVEESRIVSLLGEGPATTAELAARLGLGAAEVGRHVKSSSKLGLVRYDVGSGRYALA